MTLSALNYSLLFTTTFILVGLLTPLARKFAIKHEIYDLPTKVHSSHKEPVPYLGGVAIIAGVLITSYTAAIYKRFSSHDLLLMTSILAPALILGLIGLWDDMRNLRPAPRFIIQTVAGIFTAWMMIANDTVGNPTGSKITDAIITIIWIVGICNSINFFDNMDGGAAGTVAISSIAIFLIAFDSKQILITALAAVTIGATTGFLIWNKSPARIYMGDAGALFLGILIATLTIRLKPQAETQWTSLAIPLMLLAIPILDTTVAVTSRLKRRVSPFQGGHDHLSHRLIRTGLHRKTAVIILWGLSTLFAAAALFISKTNKTTEEILTIATSIIWLGLFIRFINTKDK